MSLLSWSGRHQGRVWLSSVVLCVALLSGGLWLGMVHASGNQPPEDAGCESCPSPALAAVTKHYVVGTIVQALPPRHIIVRTAAGRFIVVEYDTGTAVRKAANLPVRRGTKVIILGSPRAGGLHADIVTVTGEARLQPGPVQAPRRRLAPPAATPAP